MRLIDADALKESVRKKFSALSDRCEVNELVNAAPIIDAIPVEWLRGKMLNSPNELSIAAWRVLNEWHPRNEQEAR